METSDKAFFSYEDEHGETYFCPVDGDSTAAAGSEVDLDDCVEASTAGRYSGNLNVVDRVGGQETV